MSYVSEQYILKEGLLISDKTISIDLHKFESGESNMLFIIGLPASGKSTIGKILAKKYNANYIESDWIFEPPKGVNVDDFDPEKEFRNKYRELKNKNKKYVIEGVLVYWSCFKELVTQGLHPFFKEIQNEPFIILNISILQGLIRGYKRDRKSNKKRDRELSTIFRRYVKNNLEDTKYLKQFIKARTSVSNTIVKEYKP